MGVRAVDDESGWNAILLSMWTDRVCDAVVARVERETLERRGWFVRVFADPDGARPRLIETVHTLVVAAIHDETGADLDHLGSQAAWDCYQQVWVALSRRWEGGGTLATVPLGEEPAVVRALATLPDDAALAAAVDIDDHGAGQPLWLHGRLRVDADGLRRYLATRGQGIPPRVRSTVHRILTAVADASAGP